jgi:riboflavin synthase
VFTGLTADIGEVKDVARGDDGVRLRVGTRLASEIKAGDSVSVNGVCLTAVSAKDGAFEAQVMNETLSVTGLGPLGDGDRVNLELALRATDRLGGHFVQGHVDGTGEVLEAAEDGFSRRLRIATSAELLAQMVERGSVAVDGVSLTIAVLVDGAFEVSLIPETLQRTTLGDLMPGDRVNLECDVLAKYAQRPMGHHPGE